LECTVAGAKGRDTSATASSSKRKGRPRAAEVETTAEDIRSSEDFQGTPGLGRGGIFAFYSPLRILLLGFGFVKTKGKSFLPQKSRSKGAPRTLGRIVPFPQPFTFLAAYLGDGFASK
jgi:hypothetical protein